MFQTFTPHKLISDTPGEASFCLVQKLWWKTHLMTFLRCVHLQALKSAVRFLSVVFCVRDLVEMYYCTVVAHFILFG